MPKLLIRPFFIATLVIFTCVAPIAAETIIGTPQNISASVRVSPQPSDIPAVITSDHGDSITQRNTIMYTITYSSTYGQAMPMQLKASWSRGTLDGDGAALYDVVEYVDGSATNAYGNTLPIVDTTNRTITWSTSSLPNNTKDEIVTFKLRTTTNYRGDKKVNFTTSSQMSTQDLQSEMSILNQNYVFDPAKEPTPTPAPITPIPPTPVPQKPEITLVSVPEITNTTAKVFVSTDVPTRMHLVYGSSPLELTSSLRDPATATNHTIPIPDLSPNTIYYFRAYLTGKNELMATSDYYSFTTASTAPTATVLPHSLIITSNDLVLFNAAEEPANSVGFLLIPPDKPFGLRIGLHSGGTKDVHISLQNLSVLGASTASQELNADIIPLLEISPGVFTGRLKTPETSGIYGVFVGVSDAKGNKTDELVAKLKVVPTMKIVSQEGKQPIEHAVVRLWFKDANGNMRAVTPQSFAIAAPLYSAADGSVDLILPAGQYKAVVTALGYGQKTVLFSVNQMEATGYPQVVLPIQTGFFNFIRYYATLLVESLQATFYSVQAISTSELEFQLFAFLIVISTTLVTLLAFSYRAHVPVRVLPLFLLHALTKHFWKDHETFLHGIVVDDESGEGIHAAHIYVMDIGTKKVVSSTTTNLYGEFQVSIPKKHGTFKITAVRRGYEQSKVTTLTAEKLTQNVQIHMLTDIAGIGALTHQVKRYMTEGLAALFESLIILSFLLEIIFGLSLGMLKALPFLLLSLFTMSLWISHRVAIAKH